jgi:hypothetical protein
LKKNKSRSRKKTLIWFDLVFQIVFGVVWVDKWNFDVVGCLVGIFK